MNTATATDAAALLRAIIDHPDDVVRRLIYADLLDEDGQAERAEFIRTQIAHYRRDRAGIPFGDLYPNGDSELAIVSKMPDFLRILDAPGWGIDDYGWNGTGTTRIEYDNGAEADFTCGFAESIRCPLDAWKQHGESIVASHPIRRVEVTDREPWEGRDEPNAPVTYFGWWSDSEPLGGGEREWHVAAPIMCILAADDRQKKTPQPYDAHDNTGCVMFGSPELARDALNAAALLWARKKAGLA